MTPFWEECGKYNKQYLFFLTTETKLKLVSEVGAWHMPTRAKTAVPTVAT